MSKIETNSTEKIGYRSLYLERSGEHAHELVDSLLNPPELPLSDAEAVKVLDFEGGLYSTLIGDLGSIGSILREKPEESQDAPLFFAEAFLKREISVENLSVPLDLPLFESHHEVYKWIVEMTRIGEISLADLRELSKQSTAFYRRSISDSLLNNVDYAEEDVEAMPIVLDARRVANEIQAYTAVREYLLELRTIYKEGGNRTDGAKRAVIDVYLAKTNTVISEQIIYADYLMQQFSLLDNDIAAAMAMTLIPDGLRSAMQDPDTKKRLLKRLDYIRNGMGIDNGVASPVSDRLYDQSVEQSREAGMYSDEERLVLKKTMLQPDEMVAIYTQVLQKAGMLSAEDSSTWNPDRKTRASDGLYQVVHDPAKPHSFAVNGESGVYKIPTVERSIYEAMVVGGAHELKHIDQSEADREVGRTIKLSNLKGKRVSGLREAGANATQRLAERKWFGITTPISLTYVRALQVLGEGGSIGDAAKTFFIEKRQVDPEQSAIKAADEAADRVLRLVRKGGIGSQALVYAEESILEDELRGSDPEVIARATAVTSFDLVDQVRLHKYGLLPNIGGTKTIDWLSLVQEAVQPYIDKALQH